MWWKGLLDNSDSANGFEVIAGDTYHFVMDKKGGEENEEEGGAEDLLWLIY